jgi:hypothetical protein
VFQRHLESQERFSAIARLQNIMVSGLVMTEIGLDSRRQGEDERRDGSAGGERLHVGCAGVRVRMDGRVHRGGYDIEDWDFGLTDRLRRPKPALAAVQEAFASAPFPGDIAWPRISVVVCSYNGQRTIRDCLEGLLELDYPNYEVIVVNDGSTDATPLIAGEYGFRLISTANRGLSNARNTGMQAATGEIVAYTDTMPSDPHWLAYAVVHAPATSGSADRTRAAGDGPIAECVANSPGGPLHVLVTDTLQASRLQHGVSQERPAGDRWIRPAVPGGGR